AGGYGVSIIFRDGKFDVAVLSGPRVDIWPSVGVKALSLTCGDMGLSVGIFGGEDLAVRGVIPLPGTGGVALIEDAQHRLHRIYARAMIKVSRTLELPDPFPGWSSEAVLPLQTAQKLRAHGGIAQWDP